MKLWRKYAALAAALVLCLTLAACGGDDGGNGDGGSDDNFYNVPESFEGLVKDSEQMADLYVYGGAWRGEDGSTLIAAHNESGDEVRFALYDTDEEITASGFIQYVPEYDYDYFYNEHDGVAYRARFDEVGALHVTALGTFEKMLGDTPGENIGDTGYEALAGVWYLDGEAGAASILEINADGSWALYERPGGDGDPAMVDGGTLETDEENLDRYFAVSDQFDDVVYDFNVIDNSVLYWGGEYDYYEKAA